MIHIPEGLSIWITNYGSIAIFILIALSFICLPLPQNLIAAFGGILVSQGKLSLISAWSATFLGAFLAISLTYAIGKYAGFLLHRYGRYIGMTKTRIEKFDIWYEKYGKWTLLIGYYLPILRRIMGYGAGIAELGLKEFISFTLVGSSIWTSLLLYIGYLIGRGGSVLI